MSQVKITCPRCQHQYTAEEADVYECPKCGTNVRPKKQDQGDFDKTQSFNI